jgi:hypothetical protein
MSLFHQSIQGDVKNLDPIETLYVMYDIAQTFENRDSALYSGLFTQKVLFVLNILVNCQSLPPP